MLKNIILIKLLNTIQTNMRYVVSVQCKVNWDNRDTTVQNSKLHHIPPKPQLLDILRHNITRRSIQRLCYEVGELSRMRSIQADQLTLLLSVHHCVEHGLQLAGILSRALLIERFESHDEGIRGVGTNQILIAAIQKTDHTRRRFVRNGKDLHEAERLLHLLQR